MNTGFILMGVIALLGGIVQRRLKSKFAKYSKLTLQNGMSGREIAEKMLADHQVFDVKVISVRGRLTDHYNPKDKTVNLSEAVYNERNAAAAAVAAHECGHAIQHATNYSWLNLRSKMVPTANISGKLAQVTLIGGIFLVSSFPQLLLLGILLFAATVAFTFVTLPVEYDASNRALAWLHDSNMLTPNEQDGAKEALTWAARTYVVAAIASLTTLLYYVMIYMNRR